MQPSGFSSLSLRWELLMEITTHMDTAARSNWRLVSKAACQAVYASAMKLAPACPSSMQLYCATLDRFSGEECCRLWEVAAGFLTWEESMQRVKAPDSAEELEGIFWDLPPIEGRPPAAALLPHLLAKCSSFRHLSCASLHGLNTSTIPLQLLQRLESLDISCTDETDLRFIGQCTCLKRLTARDMARAASHHLAAALQQLPRLTALDLQSLQLSADAARAAAAALQQASCLQELRIGGVAVRGSEDEPATAATVALLIPAVASLQLVELSGSHDSGRLTGQALLPALLPLTGLRRLDLCCAFRSNLLGDDARALAPAIRGLQLLEDLDLDANALGGAGLAALAPSLQQLTRLTTLNLGSNFLDPSGAQALAPALRHLIRLQCLDVHSNGFGPQGAALLAPSLQQLTGLLELNLADCNLGAEGMAALAPALQRLTHLRKLDLSHSALGPRGLRALLPGIRGLASLRVLDLDENALDNESMLLFAAGIDQLTVLQVLRISADEEEESGERDRKSERMLAHIVRTSSPGCQAGPAIRL